MLCAPHTMQPLSAFPSAERARVRVVLTDIDDTLTTNGRLPAAAYAALERLHDAGIRVVPVTGRPAGWCDLIARLWPVDGVIGENGAFYFRYDQNARRMIRHHHATAEERARNRCRLDAVRAEVLAAVPGARVSADQAYREADLAIDFAEDAGPLPPASVDAIVERFEAAGAVAKISSIHVNGWYGAYDKLGMARRMLAKEFGLDIDREEGNLKVAFVGDSPNDEPMFGFFTNSVGVANFAPFADRVAQRPRWLTARSGGDGFREVAEALLEVRP
ncbi:HAD family hydrolase [Caenispirillum salinarum]|uniref:HAD family hydrolase n=1 Tax=Caenispirillum salinarum TaxID=859058 RepID=UPI00384B1FAF